MPTSASGIAERRVRTSAIADVDRPIGDVHLSGRNERLTLRLAPDWEHPLPIASVARRQGNQRLTMSWSYPSRPKHDSPI